MTGGLQWLSSDVEGTLSVARVADDCMHPCMRNLYLIACRQVMHVLVVAEYVLEFLFVARMAANVPPS